MAEWLVLEINDGTPQIIGQGNSRSAALLTYCEFAADRENGNWTDDPPDMENGPRTFVPVTASDIAREIKDHKVFPGLHWKHEQEGWELYLIPFDYQFEYGTGKVTIKGAQP